MYNVNNYKGNYGVRQENANKDKCIAYVEHHFNSSKSPEADYTVVVVGSNASKTSCDWGRWYAKAVAKEFNVPVGGDKGILVGGYKGRGNANLRFTNMPAILVESLFASNPKHAGWIRSEQGQLRLAQVLRDSICHFFPKGGTIGFSVGHKYKTSRPKDRGAKVFGGGVEADFAEKVLEKAKTLLEAENH